MAVETERVALVTGASSGIGEAAAQALLAAGFTVYGTSRRAIAGEERDGVVFLPLDVTDDQSAAGAVREVLGRSGRIDVLVNNAGFGVAGAAEESSIEQARALFDTNLFGAMRMIRAVLPQMREQGSGRVINLSSVVGLVPAPFMALYAASKHAIEGYSESLDHEVREHGVRVLLVEPASPGPRSTRIIPADQPLPVYARRRQVFDGLIAEAIKGGDEPSVVGDVIVAAATDPRPKLRYPAGPLARRVSKLRRFAPSTLFDKQIRKINQLRSSKLPRPLARAEGIKRAAVGARSAKAGSHPQRRPVGTTVSMSTTYKEAPTQTIDVGGVEFAYRQLGPSTGVPVVFLHPPGRRPGQLGPPGHGRHRRQAIGSSPSTTAASAPPADPRRHHRARWPATPSPSSAPSASIRSTCSGSPWAA